MQQIANAHSATACTPWKAFERELLHGLGFGDVFRQLLLWARFATRFCRARLGALGRFACCTSAEAALAFLGAKNIPLMAAHRCSLVFACVERNTAANEESVRTNLSRLTTRSTGPLHGYALLENDKGWFETCPDSLVRMLLQTKGRGTKASPGHTRDTDASTPPTPETRTKPREPRKEP
eukprot:6183116-Pleurochrysis_carterae.AAC.2